MAANVQSLVRYWKNFDFPGLQRELDTTAVELANRQDESETSRKKLVEQSREFKKNTSEDIRKIVAPLLKSFQSEIDNLSKRSKAAEAAFLAVYKKLLEVPDPVPALELFQSAQQKALRVQDLEIENKQLRETLNDYNEEFKEVKNQGMTISTDDQATAEKIRDQEENLERQVQLHMQDREWELQQNFKEKERQSQETHLEVMKKLEDSERKIGDLQSVLEMTQSELFDLKARYDEETHAKSDEIDIILNDLERANQKATLAEKEVSTLKERLAAAKQSLQLVEQIQKAPDMEDAVEVISRSSLEVELAAKEKEISQLMNDIQSLQSTVSNLKQASASQIAYLEELLVDKNQTIHELEEKLTQQKDYKEIKKELSILKSMEFPNNGNVEEDNGITTSGSDSIPKPLEVQLLEKNKTLQFENTALKIANTDLSGPLSHQGNQLPLQTVEKFDSLLGEKIVSTYTNILKKEDQSSPLPVATLNQDVCPSVAHQSLNDTKLSELPKYRDSCDYVILDKLQECLSQCLEKYAAETLNTLYIARCVRELLSAHNIGQRIFAKFVLGLSQGTVSELLSKPKPWEKLTEKGRESYRKMHAWTSDNTCIYMLKALMPKKGKDSGPLSSKQEDPAAEKRIAQILNEAQNAMLDSESNNKRMSPLHNGSTGHSPQNGNASRSEKKGRGDEGGGIEGGGGESRTVHSNNNYKGYLQSGTIRRSRKYDNDDIPKEMVAKIYQEELAKLMGQRVEEGFHLPRDQYEHTQEEIRHALSIYHQELSQLSQVMPLGSTDVAHLGVTTACINGTASSFIPHAISLASSLPQMPIDATVQSRSRQNDKKNNSSLDVDSHHKWGAFSLVIPETEARNSHIKVAVSHQHTSFPTTPAVSLTEISSAGDDLTMLASPLQQMQSITNSLLSQSSMTNTSSALQMPTKAVLPPITQQQFDQYINLNTENIVKNVKEELNQYSISQRLFGEIVLGLSQGSVSDLLARPKPWHMLTQKGREPFIRMKVFLEDENAIQKLVASQCKIPQEKLLHIGGFGDSSNSPDLLESSPSTPEYVPDSFKKQCHSPQSLSCLYSSVYEIAAQTSDLDTQNITSKIKDTLMTHNIGQKIFGEVVLGLSQGSVSELLSKPKPWHMLSIKGREPFIRMQLWLNDPQNVEILQAIKTQRWEANKRKRNIDAMDFCHLYNYGFSSLSPCVSTKKPRILFSDEQKEALHIAFSMDPYPNTATIESLANELNLSVQTITNWFHNRRMRLKRQPVISHDDHESNYNGAHVVSSAHVSFSDKNTASFDPVQFRLMLNNHLSELSLDKSSGKVQKMYSTYRNNSPLTNHNDDSDTLDLSLSSHNFLQRSNNLFGFQCSSETASARSDEHSNSEVNEDSSYFFERSLSESSDNEPLEEQPLPPSAYNIIRGQESIKQMTLGPSNSSNKRKSTMPQWMDQGLKMSHDYDLCSEIEDNDKEKTENKKHEEIINGVCVIQAGKLVLPVSKEHAVRIELTSAPDNQALNYRNKGQAYERDKEIDSSKQEKEEFQKNIKSDSKYNIERLERCLKDKVESWDVDDEIEREKKQQRYNFGWWLNQIYTTIEFAFSPPHFQFPAGEHMFVTFSSFYHQIHPLTMSLASFGKYHQHGYVYIMWPFHALWIAVYLKSSFCTLLLFSKVASYLLVMDPTLLIKSLPTMDMMHNSRCYQMIFDHLRQSARYEALMKEKEILQYKTDFQKKLIQQLEEDLSSVNSLTCLYRGEGEGQVASPLIPTEIIAEVSKEGIDQKVCTSLSDLTGTAENLLPIISSQRERFRQQNQELEAENTNYRQQLNLLQSEMEHLHYDNIKLYEKIKFLKCYPVQRPRSEDEMESRYSTQYEEKLDPFSRFSKQEKQRKYMNLSPFEKITLSMGHTILSNRVARIVTFIYTLLLHCLVFLVLYKLAYTEACKRDVAAECTARFALHMQKEHGQKGNFNL
ncbi:homeobox protein cut-like 1 [Tachypleus tridentatus]|uniref:homeobox protein cut-like 1 n=1 Tax=Tachypleus tridentatus TaxID=6853 RepID=UPI003FD4AF55